MHASDAPRTHPYALAFGREQLDDRLFPPIAEEAEARGHPLHDPERFLFLASVGRLLQAVATGSPEERSGAAPTPGPETAGEQAAGSAESAGLDAGQHAGQHAGQDTGSPGSVGEGVAQELEMGEELRQHGRLLYHAFHYWRAGRKTLSVRVDALRRLLEEAPDVGDWRLTTPAPAGYVQLPRNMVWAAPAEGAAPEPVDGFFWTLLREGEPTLHLLLALGVREDRPGFSVIPATGVPDDVPHWAAVDARPGGADFETTLPGGELDRLYSLETTAEVLKLASLCFYWLDPRRG